MADARPNARRSARLSSPGALLRPTALGPRLLIRTLAVVTRNTRRRRAAGTPAICATAAEHRSRPGKVSRFASGVTRWPRGRGAYPGATNRRERAEEAVVSRTTSADDLASLLAMLDLRPRPDGKPPRTEDGGGPPEHDDG